MLEGAAACSGLGAPVNLFFLQFRFVFALICLAEAKGQKAFRNGIRSDYACDNGVRGGPQISA
jgi:hypothetical protein